MVHNYTALVSIFLPPLLLLPHFSDWEKGEKFGYLLPLPRPTAGIYTIHYAMAASSHVRHTLDRDCCTISISLPTNTHTHTRDTHCWPCWAYMNLILTFSSSSFTGGKLGRMLSGRFIRMLYTEDEQEEKKGSCCCCCCWKRSLIPSLLMACPIRTIVAGLFAFFHHPSSGRFFALAGGIVTAESRGSFRHHLLLPRQNPKNKSRNCWGGKYQSTFLCDDQLGKEKCHCCGRRVKGQHAKRNS